MEKKFFKVIFPVIYIILYMILPQDYTYSEKQDVYYATYEGKIRYQGTSPFIYPVVDIGDTYISIAGSLQEELLNFYSLHVKITGPTRIRPKEVFLWGDVELQVEQYSLAGSPHFGVPYLSTEGIVIVGEDQFIYQIKNSDVIDPNLVGKKVIFSGEFEYQGDYLYLVEIIGIRRL